MICTSISFIYAITWVHNMWLRHDSFKGNLIDVFLFPPHFLPLQVTEFLWLWWWWWAGGQTKKMVRQEKNMNNNCLFQGGWKSKTKKRGLASSSESFLVTRVIRKYHYWDITESNHHIDVKAMNVFEGSVYGNVLSVITMWPSDLTEKGACRQEHTQ